MVATLVSPDHSLDQQYLSNYATLQIIDRLNRIPGVGSAQVFGGRDYSMRIWIDPDRASTLNLTVDEIIAAVRAQNAQVAAGSIGEAPFNRGSNAFDLNVQAKGRLTTPDEFGDIVVARPAAGRVIHLRDVARIELGAQDYSINAFRSGRPTVAIRITQLPGSNALDTARAVQHEFASAAKSFPPGMTYEISFNPTQYIAASISAVEHTLFEAVILVALVVLLFLQSWRAAIMPIVAIPVSLVGSFAALAAFGFSLNNLSLFGLVLAIGIVVDDAIVVVENIERLMERDDLSPREAAHKTMDEVSGALVAIALVLMGVFLPTSFIPGISGQFYKQFALTIMSATAISAFLSLTLSPALAALVLKPKVDGEARNGLRGLPRRFANRFNHRFEQLSSRYGAYTARAVRALAVCGIAYVCLIALAGWRFVETPTGFIPAQDQGYLIGVIQTPPGASLERTTEAVTEAERIALRTPGITGTLSFAGFNGATFTAAPNSAAMFVNLAPKGERASSEQVIKDLSARLAQITAGSALVIQPPPVRGIGTGGGYKMIVEDRSGAGYRALEKVASRMTLEANQTPGLTRVFTTFNTKTPRLYADIDRERAERLGVPVDSVFRTLGTYLGSTYINDFNFLGRTYRVTAEADAPYRDNVSDVERLRTRSDSGAAVPLASVLNLRNDSGPYRVVRYNLYPAAELQGDTVKGYSSGQSLASMERIADKVLPRGFSYDWTELAFQEKQAGNAGAIAFALAVTFVFLLLAALYESLVLPLAVILIVPMCLLAAVLGVNVMRLDNNILTQIGLVVLIGLAAKNAILIVEFAKQNEDKGEDRRESARHAAATRLRPILMTSIAFILGTLPLVMGNAPGSEMRQALGVAVFFGMIGVTLFGLLFTPAFYVITRNLGDWVSANVRRARSLPPMGEAA
jgi:HAE1 family hydrophobic/amphiphilic exporter-1